MARTFFRVASDTGNPLSRTRAKGLLRKVLQVWEPAQPIAASLAERILGVASGDDAALGELRSLLRRASRKGPTLYSHQEELVVWVDDIEIFVVYTQTGRFDVAVNTSPPSAKLARKIRSAFRSAGVPHIAD